MVCFLLNGKNLSYNQKQQGILTLQFSQQLKKNI